MTRIKTKNSVYPVSGVRVEPNGSTTIIAVQPSGKKRYLTRKDVGSARWYAALADFARSQVA
jgi:hypothetical protein